MTAQAPTNFNPRSPRGGATSTPDVLRAILVFQSTLPTRGSDYLSTDDPVLMPISIHAPHEGERHLCPECIQGANPISIHAPHEGERRIESAQSWHEMIISIHAPHEGERRVMPGYSTG